LGKRPTTKFIPAQAKTCCMLKGGNLVFPIQTNPQDPNTF
jgi:hypothetical protein